eukprot:CAMPEP_0177640420 /NCGR_PEP_ID=MMETSP0447-20121125/6533_1 /TAXON_ID=0 /ORGANISM="Stygamoeba regulata, Strain BSH-02190019" /LENGTH=154 /DNA_ID=CAMNT_0019142489 /DNA_START=145 /DNA_END=606 /DNA_ORIENTATION=-
MAQPCLVLLLLLSLCLAVSAGDDGNFQGENFPGNDDVEKLTTDPKVKRGDSCNEKKLGDKLQDVYEDDCRGNSCTVCQRSYCKLTIEYWGCDRNEKIERYEELIRNYYRKKECGLAGRGVLKCDRFGSTSSDKSNDSTARLGQVSSSAKLPLPC